MNLIIYGAGSFARMMRYYFTNYTNHNVVTYCVDDKYFLDTAIDELPVTKFSEIVQKYPPATNNLFVAMGYSNMRSREKMYSRAKEKGYTLVNFVSPEARIDESVSLGDNNAIFAGTYIEPFVSIGSNNIFWTSTVICHDSIIGSHSFFAAKCVVGGFSKIENGCFVGFNSTIIQNITLAEETLVGAASLIRKDTQKFSVNIGAPSKQVGTHAEEGIKIL